MIDFIGNITNILKPEGNITKTVAKYAATGGLALLVYNGIGPLFGMKPIVYRKDMYGKGIFGVEIPIVHSHSIFSQFWGATDQVFREFAPNEWTANILSIVPAVGSLLTSPLE